MDSVGGLETGTGRRYEQIVEPIVMVNEAVELVGWRIEPFTNIGPRTIRPEVVQNGPGADL